MALVKEIMKMKISRNLKLTAGLSIMVLLGVGAATVAISQTGGDEPTAQEIAARTRDAYAALSSYSDSGKVVSEMSGQTNSLDFNIRLQRPNLYRIDWTQKAGLMAGVPADNGVVWSDGSGDYFQTTANRVGRSAETQRVESVKTALNRAAGPSWSIAATIPGAFFNENFGDVFAYPAILGRYPIQKEKDGKVGAVDCYVVSTEMDLSKAPDAGKPGTVAAMLWIGKTDFLIRQTRTRYKEKVDDEALSSDQALDDAIRKSLEMQNKPVTPQAIADMRPQMKTIMKQVRNTLKAGFTAGIVMTQTHENISVNQKFSPSDFAR
jgi:outer membrane lipoprotein-sorting protein